MIEDTIYTTEIGEQIFFAQKKEHEWVVCATYSDPFSEKIKITLTAKGKTKLDALENLAMLRDNIFDIVKKGIDELRGAHVVKT